MGNILIHNHNLEESQAQNKEISHIGFYYNGKHSSEMGIVRTSDGSRYNENLLPTIQDKTVQVPGGNGMYFFGSYYTQKQFNISFAFDALTETQFAELRRWLGDKQIHELIFDELPYKTYQAKVTGTATIKHVPFGTEGETRIYKGEGSVQFTCYYPYAVCKKKWLDDYSNFNKAEWQAASGLKSSSDKPSGNDDPYDAVESFLREDGTISPNGVIQLYNAGDIDADFEFKINFIRPKINETPGTIPEGYLTLKSSNNKKDSYLYWKDIKPQGEDTYLIINTKLNLIEGYNSNGKTGNVYNDCITDGVFFKVPKGESQLLINGVLRYIDLPKPYSRDKIGIVENNKEVYKDNLADLTSQERQEVCPVKYNYYYF